MDKLPIEVKQQICELLENTHFPSVATFASVSTRCHAAAAASLFRIIQITVSFPHELASDADQLSYSLKHWDAFKHVRHLKIEGSMREMLSRRHVGTGIHLGSLEQDVILAEYAQEVIADDALPEDVYHMDHLWSALASLVEHLPALSVLEYAATNQLSPCILQALHMKDSVPKLWMSSFKIRSLRWPEVNDHELALLKSPTLSRITLVCNGEDPAHREQHLIARLVSGLSPNLEAIRFFHQSMSPVLYETTMNPFEPESSWSRALGDFTPSFGALSELHLDSWRQLDSAALKMWRRHTNLSSLKVLDIQTALSRDAIEWLFRERPFASLRSLRLCFDSDPDITESTRYFMDASELIASVPALHTLGIHGWIPPVMFETALVRHHASLRRLIIHPSGPPPQLKVNASILEQVRDRCPQLERLDITINRSRGDKEEIAIYEALGQLDRLQYLDIFLDASVTTTARNRPLPPRRGQQKAIILPDDGFDRREFLPAATRILNYHVRDVFVNSALDESLACEIFRAICRTKQISSLPLLRLNLRMDGVARFDQFRTVLSVQQVTTQLGRSWSVKPHPRDDAHGVLVAKELDPPQETQHFLSANVSEIFRRIWPQVDEASHWSEAWESFPLYGMRSTT